MSQERCFEPRPLPGDEPLRLADPHTDRDTDHQAGHHTDDNIDHHAHIAGHDNDHLADHRTDDESDHHARNAGHDNDHLADHDDHADHDTGSLAGHAHHRRSYRHSYRLARHLDPRLTASRSLAVVHPLRLAARLAARLVTIVRSASDAIGLAIVSLTIGLATPPSALRHRRLRGAGGQATTEYALVLLAAALIALLVVAWATAGGGGARVSRLFNRVIDAVVERV